jgi:hypothetical protein
MGPPIGPRNTRPGIAPEEGDRRPADRPPFEQMPGERFARQSGFARQPNGAEPRARVDPPTAEPPARVDPPAAPEAPAATSEAMPMDQPWTREPTAVEAAPSEQVAREPSAPQPMGREPVHQGERQPAPPVGREPRPVAGEHAPLAAREPASPSIDDAPSPIRAAGPGAEPMERGASTAPQLRRFIKSRAYVPMHELRRRFGINGNDDDVTTIELERGRIYVGLPDPEGRLLGELLRAGDIGYELSRDPLTPIVVGVYPMRPVPRP